jgi:hypothetical protein
MIINVLVVLYGSESWSRSLREELDLSVGSNRKLVNIAR